MYLQLDVNMNLQESIRRVLKEETSIKKKLLNTIDKFGLLNTIRIVGGFDKLTRIIGRGSITKEQKIELIVEIVKEYGEDGYYLVVRYYDIFIDIDINFTDSNDYITEVMDIFDNGRIDINQYPYDDEMEEHDFDNPTRKGVHLSHLSESDIDGIIAKLFENLKRL